MQRLRQFIGDESGATVVEFALVAGVLFTILFITIEFAIIWLQTAMLENAMVTASRYARTNYSYSGTDAPDYDACSNLPRNDTVICLVRRLGGGMMNPDEISFNARVLGKNWGAADLSSTTSGTGTKGDIVIYEAQYMKPILNPLIRPFFSGGVYVIKASTLTQNEQ